MIFVRKIDEQGFFIEDSFIEEINEFTIETPCPQGFYKPRWTGSEWTEGATQEYIDNIKNVVVEPTENEIIMLAIAELDAQRELDKTETELAIAELAETLLGGI